MVGGGSGLSCSFFVSMLWLTVSNALDRSRATRMVRCAGLRWLRPLAMLVFRLRSADVVECFFLKPCW